MSAVLSVSLVLSLVEVKALSNGDWGFFPAAVATTIAFDLMALGCVFVLIGTERCREWYPELVEGPVERLADRRRDGRQAPDAAASPLRWPVVRGMDRLGTVISLILASSLVVIYLVWPAQTECMQPFDGPLVPFVLGPKDPGLWHRTGPYGTVPRYEGSGHRAVVPGHELKGGPYLPFLLADGWWPR